VEEYTFVGLRDQVFASPLYVNQFSVSAFDLLPWPYERFELKYTTPGTYVTDGTFPEVEGKVGISYTIPADAEQLDAVIAAARANYHTREKADQRTARLRALLYSVNGVLLVCLIVYYFVRLRKARSQ
jgi:hypothetical protein